MLWIGKQKDPDSEVNPFHQKKQELVQARDQPISHFISFFFDAADLVSRVVICDVQKINHHQDNQLNL